MALQLKLKTQQTTPTPRASKGAPTQRKYSNRINHEIKASQVRVISDDPEVESAVMSLNEALSLADQKETDLVEISSGDVPVVKLIDFDKFCFQLDKKSKNSQSNNKKQKQVQFHPSIAENDIQHKVKHISDFITEGHRVEVICKFKGRENQRKQFGYELFDKVVEQLQSVAKKDGDVKLNGNNIVMYLVRK